MMRLRGASVGTKWGTSYTGGAALTAFLKRPAHAPRHPMTHHCQFRTSTKAQPRSSATISLATEQQDDRDHGSQEGDQLEAMVKGADRVCWPLYTPMTRGRRGARRLTFRNLGGHSGAVVSVGGPAFTYYLTPTEDELRARYNPDLRKKSIEQREEREQEFDEFVTRLKEYSKSDKPSLSHPYSSEPATRTADDGAPADEAHAQSGLW